MLTYPWGTSPIFYIGKATKLRRRLETHKKHIRSAEDDHEETYWWQRYQYGAAFGADCAYYSHSGPQNVQNIEARLIERFYRVFGAIPAANSSWPREIRHVVGIAAPLRRLAVVALETASGPHSTHRHPSRSNTRNRASCHRLPSSAAWLRLNYNAPCNIERETRDKEGDRTDSCRRFCPRVESTDGDGQSRDVHRLRSRRRSVPVRAAPAREARHLGRLTRRAPTASAVPGASASASRSPRLGSRLPPPCVAFASLPSPAASLIVRASLIADRSSDANGETRPSAQARRNARTSSPRGARKRQRSSPEGPRPPAGSVRRRRIERGPKATPRLVHVLPIRSKFRCAVEGLSSVATRPCRTPGPRPGPPRRTLRSGPDRPRDPAGGPSGHQSLLQLAQRLHGHLPTASTHLAGLPSLLGL